MPSIETLFSKPILYCVDIDFVHSTDLISFRARICCDRTGPLAISKHAVIDRIHVDGKLTTFRLQPVSRELSNRIADLVGLEVEGETSLIGKTHKIEISYSLPQEHFGVGEFRAFAIYNGWYPYVDIPAKRAYSLRIEHPAHVRIVGSGSQCTSTSAVGITVTKLSSSRPEIDICFCSIPNTGLIVAENALVKIFSQCMEDRALRVLADEFERIIQFLEGETEMRPSGVIKIVIASAIKFPYARNHLIMLPAESFAGLCESSALSVDGARLLVHEMVHCWMTFTDPLSSCRWIDEGLAEHLAVVYVNRTIDPAALHRQCEATSRELSQSVHFQAPARVDVGDVGYFPQTYLRGAMLMGRVRQLLGLRHFAGLLRSLYDLGRARYIGMNELVALSCANPRYRFPVDLGQWLGRSRIPNLVFRSHSLLQNRDSFEFDIEFRQVGRLFTLDVVICVSDLCIERRLRFRVRRRYERRSVRVPMKPVVIIVEPDFPPLYRWKTEGTVDWTRDPAENDLSTVATDLLQVTDITAMARCAERLAAAGLIDQSLCLWELIRRLQPEHGLWLVQSALVHLAYHNGKMGNTTNARRLISQALAIPDCRGSHRICQSMLNKIEVIRDR